MVGDHSADREITRAPSVPDTYPTNDPIDFRLAPIASLMSGHGGLAHEQASPVNV